MNTRCFVYFVQSGYLGPIKIGKAKNVTRRLATLQAGNPVKITLITSIPCPSQKSAYRLESRLHQLFRKQRIRGEWFSADIRLSRISELEHDEEMNPWMGIDELSLVQSAREAQ